MVSIHVDEKTMLVTLGKLQVVGSGFETLMRCLARRHTPALSYMSTTPALPSEQIKNDLFTKQTRFLNAFSLPEGR
jgi:hypothetical protein